MTVKPTHTRQELRQDICLKLDMPFHQRHLTSKVSAVDSDVYTFTDTNLVQADDYWNGGYIFMDDGTGIGEMRKIIDFSAATSTADPILTPERPITGLASSDAYEITNVFSPSKIHSAINSAIRVAFPSFFDTVEDQTLVICQDKMSYDLTGLTSKVWLPLQVYIEKSLFTRQGTVTSAAATTLVDTHASFSDVTTNFKVSIYSGKGAGQIRAVTSVTGSTQLNVATWTTTPDATSKYKVWDASRERVDWYRIMAVRFNDKEYPSMMYFTAPMDAVVGLRIRLVYTAQPLELAADTDSTPVPMEFITNKALSVLAGDKVNDTRSDRARYALMEKSYSDKAEMFRISNSWRAPAIPIWQETDYNIINSNVEDPMGWRNDNG